MIGLFPLLLIWGVWLVVLGIREKTLLAGKKCSFQGFSIAIQFLKANATEVFLTSTGMRLPTSFIIPAELIHATKCEQKYFFLKMKCACMIVHLTSHSHVTLPFFLIPVLGSGSLVPDVHQCLVSCF